MKNIGLGKILCMVAAFWAVTAAATDAQTYNVGFHPSPRKPLDLGTRA
jgi:hypothetical protein